VTIPAHFEANMPSLTGWGALESSLGNRKLATTVFVSAMYLFGIVGQLVGGRAADRFDLRRTYLLFHACSLPCMLGIALFTEVPLLLVSLAYIFFALGMQPVENSLVARLTPPHLRGTGYGLKFVLVLGFSAFSVKGVRWLMAHGRTSDVFLVQSALIAGVIALILVIYLHSRRQTWRNA
jgi:MFS family permease